MSDKNTTTLLDLYQSAYASAMDAIGKDNLTVEKNKLTAFDSGKFDAGDYDQFNVYFQQTLNQARALKNQPSPAARAAAQPVKPAVKPTAPAATPAAAK